MQDGLGMNELENVVKTLEDENNLSNRTLIDANRKIENLKENLSEELNSLKAANENELNFFHKNHEAIKVCTIIFTLTNSKQYFQMHIHIHINPFIICRCI